MSTEAEVLAAAAALVAAFGRHDTDAYFSCFAPEATFVFYAHHSRLNSRAEYAELWAGWERDDGFLVLSCASSQPLVQDLGETAVFTHAVRTVVRTSAGEEELNERETIVFRRTDLGWLAVHEHLSPLPA